MTRPPLLSLTEARAALGYLQATTQVADLTIPAPIEWIKRLLDVVRSIAPREEQHRYRLELRRYRNQFHTWTAGADRTRRARSPSFCPRH